MRCGGYEWVWLGVELIGVPLAESVEFASFADSTQLYLLSALLFADIS